MAHFRDLSRTYGREYFRKMGVGEAATDRGFISIETYVDQALAVFDGLQVNVNQIKKRLMTTTGRGAKNYAKRNFNVLKSRTGTLKKSIDYRLGKDGDYVVITNNATSGKATERRELLSSGSKRRNTTGLGVARNARYGFMLAHGYVSTAKTSRGLTFNINGKWVTKMQVIVQPKDWIEPPVDRYVDSSENHNKMDKELQRQIDYWEKRLTKA